MKRLFTIVLMAVLASLTITAQTTTTAASRATTKKLTKANVTGYVKDSETGEALVRATIQIMSEDTTKMITGGVTNTLGGYTIKNVEEGNYVVKISYIGYHDFFRKMTVKNAETIHNVGTVLLTPNSILIEGAVVTGAMPQVEVHEDTLIFNADAFKVPEGSVLEDLVKKLPGAEVDEDGNIKINGKSITQILVNGKEFFSNDRNMAMKNLPTEIIDKIKTYDKQSDQARLSGIDDGNEQTVIDLTIKKGMNRGWFGNINGGVGTNDLYNGRINLNRFQEEVQGSIISNLSSQARNGGRAKNSQFGLNLVSGSEEEGNIIGGNIRYTGGSNTGASRSSSENYVTTKTTYSNRSNTNRSTNDGISGDMRIEWQLDSMSRLLFRPNFSYSGSTSRSRGLSAQFNENPYDFDGITDPLNQLEDIAANYKNYFVNKNESASKSNNTSYNFGGNLTYNRRFSNGGRNSGRNIQVNASGSYSHSDGKNFNLSDAIYYQRGDSADYIYRYRTSPNNNTNLSGGFSYSEPLGNNGWYLQFSYNLSYSKRKSDSNTYNLGKIQSMRDSIATHYLGYLPDMYNEYLDDDLSNYTLDKNINQNINLNVRWNTTYIVSSVGIQMQPQHQKIEYDYQNIDTIASRNYFRISPTANIQYRFNRQHTIRFTYRGNMRQPSITDLFDITDDSNPLSIRKGNPNLKPSFTNNYSIQYNNYLTATMQTINGNFSFSNTSKNIGQKTQYNEETGGSISQPVNIDGNWDVSGNIGFNTPLFSNERFMINTSTSASYSNQAAYIYQNHETLKNQVNNLRLGENIRISYRSDYWDIGARGQITYMDVDNKFVEASSRNTFDFSYGFSSTGNFENGFGYSTDINMSSRRGYSSKSMNTNQLIWNAQVSYRFLKNRALTVSLAAYDILNQRDQVSRSISATGRTDQEVKNVSQYLMLNLTYRFNLFGSRSGRQNLRQERADREQMRANMPAAGAGMPAGGGMTGGPRGGFGGGNMGGGGRF